MKQLLDELPDIDVAPTTGAVEMEATAPSATEMPPAPTGRQIFQATRGRRRKLSQEVLEQGSEGIIDNRGASVFHSASEKVTMYKPTDRGFSPRIVPSDSIAMNLANGWREVCPDCKGTCGPTVNDCPARPKVKFISCPVCRKRFYAERPLISHAGGTSRQPHDAGGRFAHAGDRDLNEIESPYGHVDVGAQIKARVDRHLLAFHQEEARALQISPLDLTRDVRVV